MGGWIIYLLTYFSVFQAVVTGGKYAQESRRQPDRCLEFSLAANSILLFLLGLVATVPGSFRSYVSELVAGGSVLAIAAALVDQWARREAKRQAASPRVARAASVTSAPQGTQALAPAAVIATPPVVATAAVAATALQQVVVGAPRRN